MTFPVLFRFHFYTFTFSLSLSTFFFLDISCFDLFSHFHVGNVCFHFWFYTFLLTHFHFYPFTFNFLDVSLFDIFTWGIFVLTFPFSHSIFHLNLFTFNFLLSWCSMFCFVFSVTWGTFVSTYNAWEYEYIFFPL